MNFIPLKVYVETEGIKEHIEVKEHKRVHYSIDPSPGADVETYSAPDIQVGDYVYWYATLDLRLRGFKVHRITVRGGAWPYMTFHAEDGQCKEFSFTNGHIDTMWNSLYKTKEEAFKRFVQHFNAINDTHFIGGLYGDRALE